jgi:2-polyprenyl-6-methoxyphenol hydroxylase-like FAD-dependent oxidoreductase
MSGLNVLVVGASIAGPATAYWLAKAGARVTVIERFPSLRTSGQAVDIRTAGVSVMRKMSGMEAQVRAKSTQEEGVCFVRENGRPYGIIRATGDPDRQSLISEYEIFRGDLSRILVDLSRDIRDVKYIFGEQIASMTQGKEADPVTVEFANGLPTAEYDLVVACDGATKTHRSGP